MTDFMWRKICRDKHSGINIRQHENRSPTCAGMIIFAENRLGTKTNFCTSSALSSYRREGSYRIFDVGTVHSTCLTAPSCLIKSQTWKRPEVRCQVDDTNAMGTTAGLGKAIVSTITQGIKVPFFAGEIVCWPIVQTHRACIRGLIV